MRKQLCDALVARAALQQDMVFLTGDLGFMAMEPLQAALGPRFINAGVAEQNMVSVAAGLARQGMEVWAYSIAPFCYARAFEQIRNDVAFHDLPVKLIGNGGGYGYGVMGPTHHAIEDYGVLLTLPNMRVLVPAFDEDMAAVVEQAGHCAHPAYIRMGRGELPAGVAAPAYAPWRQLTTGGGPVIIAVGPLAGTLVDSCNALSEGYRPNLWVMGELPLFQSPLPDLIVTQLGKTGELHVVEEHVARGSVGSELALYCLQHSIRLVHFVHHPARAHHFERYGSQTYLRHASELDAASILKKLHFHA